MSTTIINLIIQLVAGALGGNALGGIAKNMSIGTGGNTIAGALGGLAGGSLLTSLISCIVGRCGRHGHRRARRTTRRRRRIGRDRDRDRRHDHEEHEAGVTRPKGAWWAIQGSNLWPLPCEGSALPLS